MATSLRADTARVVRLADRDLSRLWRLVAEGASAETALRDLIPAIVEQYGAAGAAVAAEWYDQQREKIGARGVFEAMPFESSDRGAQALIGWALDTATDDASLRTLIAGGVQRRIADHARLTVMGASVEDRAARGWRRVGTGSSCPFCSLLLSRGAVYTEATADFRSHDHCDCGAAPDWR